MPSIEDLLGKEAELDVEMGDSVIHVVYDPTLITPEYLSDPNKSVGESIVEVVIDWDLETRPAKNRKPMKVPITAAGIDKIPSVITSRIFQALVRGRGSEGEAAASSNGGSFTTGS